MAPPYTLLICTVGGTPGPIVASLKHWRPGRVVFVPSEQTRPEITEKVLPLAEQEGFVLPVGSYDLCVVPDPQDFTACVRKLRELVPEVSRWLARGPDHDVVVDYTAGTKNMSAALALQAHGWGCRFSYVGGSERTRENVGVVVSGKEVVLHVLNPWEVLGCQAVEDFVTLFDQGAHGAGARLLQNSLQKVQDAGRKRELTALRTLAEAYDAWDRFQHEQALRLLRDVRKYENDLRSLLGGHRADGLLRSLERHEAYLGQLADVKGPTRARVIDLLANARRRLADGRFDDAVARLYRSLEALAQTRLREAYQIEDTGEVPLERLPGPLRQELGARAVEGKVWVALQDDYALLRAHGDALGERFHRLGLADRKKSPLQARNSSILAHGFDPVSEKACKRLWEAALELAEIGEQELPVFPRLGEK